MSDSKSESFSDIIGKNLGQLFVISMIQARATLTLADAIRKDSNVSAETREKAEDAIQIVDRLIEQMESAMPDLGAPTTIKEFVGRRDE